MTRRRLILGYLLGASMLFSGLLLAAWPRRTAIRVENFKKLKAGMTLVEVEALFGGPARDERTAEDRDSWAIGALDLGVGQYPGREEEEERALISLRWQSRELRATLLFAPKGGLVVGYGEEGIEFNVKPWWEKWRDRLVAWFRP